MKPRKGRRTPGIRDRQILALSYHKIDLVKDKCTVPYLTKRKKPKR